MLCKNCGYTLSGNEKFCPECAAPTKNENTLADKKLRQEEVLIPEESNIVKQEYIFPEKEKEQSKPQRHMQIFADEPEDIQEKPVKEKNYAGRILLLLFLICVFAAATFAVTDYFDLTSAVFNLTKAQNIKEIPSEVYDHKSSVIKPDISLLPSSAYVVPDKGLTLRKGPGRSYAALTDLRGLTQLQLCGESLTQEGWVYVYCAEEEIYGWADAAFITDGAPEQKNTTAAVTAATVEEGSYIQ